VAWPQGLPRIEPDLEIVVQLAYVYPLIANDQGKGLKARPSQGRALGLWIVQ
jgi:hypothetical protein